MMHSHPSWFSPIQQNPAGRRSGKLRQRLAAFILTGLILILPLVLCGCLSAWLRTMTEDTPEISYPVITGETRASSGTSGTSAQPITEPSLADFATQVRELLLQGLFARQREIVIDEAISGRMFPEADIQQVIDQIFHIYEDIYLEYADFYYLNGSINVSYSILKTEQPILNTMTVKPLYWTITDDLTDQELDALMAQVENKVTEIAASIQGETQVPWQQLQRLHDILVRDIAYDESSNVENNQVFSALLDGKTLCQGYARSFQLVAAKMGYDVVLISGETDGVGHVWDLVNLDGEYYHVDVTHDDPTPDGGAKAPVQHVHFLRSDDAMQETHTWETTDFPACPEDGAQYYRQQNLTAASQAILNQKIKDFCAGLHYSVKRTNLLELLFTGDNLPTLPELESMIKKALLGSAGGAAVHYRYQISKSVILVEVITSS